MTLSGLGFDGTNWSNLYGYYAWEVMQEATTPSANQRHSLVLDDPVTPTRLFTFTSGN